MTIPSHAREPAPLGLPTAQAVAGTTHSMGPAKSVEKVIVAVHGIGDQASFGTIQTVVNQFCSYFGQPSGIPLGSFDTGDPALCIGEPHEAEVFKRYAFSEVYWAPIPRALARDEHRLEESKAWARTIVERLRLHYEIERRKVAAECERRGQKPAAPQSPDFRLIKQVLGELIQTIAVVDRLCFLADKAGIFRFALRRLLDDYLGDVQVVAEFKQERAKILEAFAMTMERIADPAAHPDAEIYIISHSEGTVVAFLGLLEGFRKSPRPNWTNNVRGLMTLGSPIDKHLVLWPDIFGGSPPTPAAPGARQGKIQWRNYYDFGDPVGFELDGTRDWLASNQWESVFAFSNTPGKDDYGFSRYPFPGKAHVDYWNDEHVFGHFLENVVDRRGDAPPPAPHRFAQAPRTKPLAWLASTIVPYVGIAAILFAASYIMLRAVLDITYASTPDNTVKTLDIAIRAGGIAALLAGMTVISRVIRLTRRWDWRAASVVVAVASILLFLMSVNMAPFVGDDPATLWTAGAATATIAVVSYIRPAWGMAPMLWIGGGASAIRIVGAIIHAHTERPDAPVDAIWPLLLAFGGFIYLWWLATLIFDLVVAWQLYIRGFNLRRQLDKITGRAKLETA
jgi:hypothetical protein